jgi:hypothetical protein
MAQATDRPTFNADDLARARSAFAGLLALLRGQPGGETVLVAVSPEGAQTEFLATHLRRMRRALYPMSPELRALTMGDRSPANNALRRKLREVEYPEPKYEAAVIR